MSKINNLLENLQNDIYFLIQLHTEELFSAFHKIFRFCFSIPLKDVQKNNLVMITMHNVLTMKNQKKKTWSSLLSHMLAPQLSVLFIGWVKNFRHNHSYKEKEKTLHCSCSSSSVQTIMRCYACKKSEHMVHLLWSKVEHPAMITLFFSYHWKCHQKTQWKFSTFYQGSILKNKRKHVAFKMAVRKDTCNISHQINNIN